jgi:hypothetical protein
MRLARRSLLLPLVLLLPLAAGAETPLRLDAADLDSQRTAIETDLAGNERYREISAEDRRAVLEALERIDAHLADGRDPAALDDATRVELAAAAEQVNILLARAAADSRMICARERPIGTRMAVNVCRSAADRRRDREQAQGISRGDRPAESL